MSKSRAVFGITKKEKNKILKDITFWIIRSIKTNKIILNSVCILFISIY